MRCGRRVVSKRAGVRACGRHALCLVHLVERGVCLGEVGGNHLFGKLVGVVLVKIEDLIEGLEVDGTLRLPMT